MRIKKVYDGEGIDFDNGHEMHDEHAQDCCEINYADWKQIEDEALDYDFKEPLDIERAEGGFRFGNKGIRMFYIPCYTVQNGYYSDLVDIYYNEKLALDNVRCYEE